MNETIIFKSGVETSSIIEKADFPVLIGTVEYYLNLLIEKGHDNKTMQFLAVGNNVTYKGKPLKRGQRIYIKVENGKVVE